MSRFVGLLLGALMLFVSGCADGVRWRSVDGATWGTTYHIKYLGDKDLSDSVRMVMREVELSLSPFDAASRISAINHNRSMEVDSMIVKVFEASVLVNRLSGGLFDPTVGPLVRMWGFGEDKSVREAPGKEAIDSALQWVGIGDCRVECGQMVKKHCATTFNFSAITKGMGCDAVGEMLRRNGCENYLVEIGGELALRGCNEKGEPWRVMIDAPVESEGGVSHERMAVVALSDCGVATSGNYRNYRDYGEVRVGHTISPVTGRPVSTATLSATVIAPEAMMADALATACMAMEADSAVAMVDGLGEGISALLVTAGSDGGLDMRATSGFPRLR